MALDWFTIGAQIVNFLVLVFLLHRFLYGPIIRAMDAREQRIAARLQEAEEKQRHAEEEAETYRRKNDEFERQRAQRWAEMEEQIEDRRKVLMEEVREETEEMRHSWQAVVRRNRQDFLRDLRTRASRGVYDVARRALADVADTELETQATRAFLQRLHNMEDAVWQDFQRSIHNAQDPAIVRSAFDLSGEQRRKIQETLQEYAGNDLRIEFETVPDLITGIELQAYSHIAAWHLQDYLNMLEERTIEMLEEAAPQAGDEQDTDEDITDEDEAKLESEST